MRVNSNKKIHKMKRDPYKTLLRTAGILAIVVVVGVGVFYLCSLAVTNDYVSTRNRIENENAEAELEFNAMMNELRAEQSAALAPNTGVVSSADLPSWEKTLNDTLWRIEDESNAGLENTSTITLDRASLINGGLLLVNPWHSLPSDFSEEGLVSIGTASNFQIQVQDNSVRVFQPAYDALSEALTAAKDEAGLEYYIVMEGYRSVAQQEELFNAEMEKLSSRYSGNALIEETKKNVNYPGNSDYHTGMSFRMDVYQRDNAALNNLKFQAASEQGAWLTENCWRFGIIFRFPTADFPKGWEDKSYKTGVSAQLNLYRYVGKAHSAAMRVLNLCLEEYIEFLIAHPHICVYEDGALKYEIVRIKIADDAQSVQLPVPNPASSYQVSLDNMGGVVMAYTY